jgi:putative flavoprotein involved in K+ transport
LHEIHEEKSMGNMKDVIVIGAGQAGLAASYLLGKAGFEHVVLERGEIGESWRAQRWDSFCLNTPNWTNNMPGMEFYPEEGDGFATKDQVVAFFEGYVSTFDLPIRPHITVTALEKLSNGKGYVLEAGVETLRARAVVLASGGLSRPRTPAMSQDFPMDINVLTAGTYRNPDALPIGAVLVIGSGQSGCQIAEDLLQAGRRVYLCASRVARSPRAYRGRDALGWMRDLGLLDVKLEELDDPAMEFATQPQVSGTEGGHTVSLQSLARDGATLLGRVLGVEGHTLKLGNDLQDCIDFADEKSRAFKSDIDNFIERNGIDAPPPEADPGEPELPDLNGSGQLDSLDMRKAGISTVIWCTGYDADWSWVKIDVFDERGLPRHRAGITDSGGLYFLGMPWLSKRKSGILYGVGEDATRIVNHIESYLPSENHNS